MDELLGALEADFDDAEGWLRIVGSERGEDDLTLRLSVAYHDLREIELWEISCQDVVEDALSSGGSSSLSLSADAPLLKLYTEPQVDLMFSENAMAPAAMFGIVCASCIAVLGRAETIPRLLNLAPTTAGIASSAYGLLGRFPKSVVAHILYALKDHPIRLNPLLPGFRPTRHNGSGQAPYEGLQMLAIGPSYVIAGGFHARRIDDDDC